MSTLAQEVILVAVLPTGEAGQLRQVPGARAAPGLGDGCGAPGPEADLLHPRHHAGRVRDHAGELNSLTKEQLSLSIIISRCCVCCGGFALTTLL